MLLLGVRAAVRRAITIACTKKELTSELLDRLPFNLRELNLISFHNENDGLGELVSAISAGLLQSKDASRYLDLPVYDYVREEPAESDSESVLFLHAYGQYAQDGARKPFVHKRIRDFLNLSDPTCVQAVIDQSSPRLAEMRLYEAIRHWPLCLVDLTWWRPNVLFELGVRLAVRPAKTFIIFDKSVENSVTDSQSTLVEFLEPFSYTLDTLAFSSMHETSNRHIYDVATQHFRNQQDNYSESVDTILLRAADITPGHDDPLQTVELTPLYARDNRAYGEEVRHSVFERLCAAWYYLVYRNEIHRVRPIDLLNNKCQISFLQFRRLSSRLKTSLTYRYSASDERLQRNIVRTTTEADKSGAVKISGLLEIWSSIKQEQPWTLRVCDVDESDIEDLEFYIDSMNTLFGHFEDTSLPDVKLVLQGLESHSWQLSNTLKKLRGAGN